MFCFLILEKCTSSYTILTGLILGDCYLKIKKRVSHLVMTHPLFGFYFFFFFFFLMPKKSRRPLKSFFMMRPRPCVFRLLRVK